MNLLNNIMEIILGLLALVISAGGQPPLTRCTVTSPAGHCSRIDQLPDCNSNSQAPRKYNLSTCQYNFLEPSNIRSLQDDIFGECADSGRYSEELNLPETDEGELNIIFTPHNKAEANITVSWEHLHLNITPGSTIEFKLYDSAITQDCSPFCRPLRYLCTNHMLTSYIINGTKYGQVNEIQFVILTDSVVKTRIRTQFASASRDFNCTNPNIMPYNPRTCPPTKYGAVRNMTVSEDSSGSTMALISWLPPEEDELYHIDLHYLLMLTTFNGTTRILSEHYQPHYYNVSSMSPVNLSIGPFGHTLTYEIGVRAYISCGGCASGWVNVTHTPLPPSTSTQGIVTTEPSTATEVATATVTVQVPTSTETGLRGTAHILPVALVVPLLVVALVISLIVGVVSISIKKKKEEKKKKKKSESQPSTIPVLPSSPPGLQLVRLSDGYFRCAATSVGPTSNDPLADIHSFGTPPLSTPPPFALPTDNTLINAPAATDNPSDTDSQTTIDLSQKKYKALVVFSPRTMPESADEIRKNLVGGLHLFYSDIKPLCYDFVSLRNQPFVWLQDEEPKADAVLCVCTKEFQEEWEGFEKGFHFIQALKNIIRSKQFSKEGYSKFASVLLKPEDEEFIPDLLRVKQHFMINDLNSIAGFIKNMPTHVFPQNS